MVVDINCCVEDDETTYSFTLVVLTLFWWRSGGKFKSPVPEFYYLSGGAGYTISRATLKAFVEQVLPVCEPTVIVSFEDLMVSKCLWSHLDVKGYDARDSRGSYRYHSFSPEFMFSPALTTDKRDKSFRKQNRKFMKKHYNIPFLHGIHAVSKESIGFHRIRQPLLHYRMYQLLYHEDPADADVCQKSTIG